MEEGVLRLKWRDHRATFTRTLTSLRTKGWYCDATLACEGRFYPVHRLVLGGCSEFFQRMFEVGEVTQQVVVVLADLCHQDLEALLDYMYVGEANILQGDLSRFMRAAEALKIRGLAEPVQSSPERELGEGKRSLSSQEDNRDAKRRKDVSIEKQKTIKYDSDASSKISKGSEEDQGGLNDEAEIVSPAQLAAVELNTLPDLSSTQSHTTTNTHTTTTPQHGDTTHTQQSPLKFEDIQVKEELHEWGRGVDEEGGVDEDEANAYGTFASPGLTYQNPQTSSQQPAAAYTSTHQPQQTHPTAGQPVIGWDGGAVSDQAVQRTPFQVLVKEEWEWELQEMGMKEEECEEEEGEGLVEYEEEEESEEESEDEDEDSCMSDNPIKCSPDVPDEVLHLTPREETHLIHWLNTSEELGFCHRNTDMQNVLSVVQKLFIRKERKTPYENSLPDYRWCHKFLRRFREVTGKLGRREFIPKSLATYESLKLWYSDLERLVTDISASDILEDPRRIFSASTIIFPVTSFNGRVFEPRTEQDQHTSTHTHFLSVMNTVCGSGLVAPGAVIFPQNMAPRPRDSLEASQTTTKIDSIIDISKDFMATTGEHVNGKCSVILDNNVMKEWHIMEASMGTIEPENLVEYINDVFIPWLEQEKVPTPVLLFLHGRYTNFITPEICQMYKDKLVIVHALHPYTVLLKLEPAVMSLCDPVTSAWRTEVNKWKDESDSPAVTCFDFLLVLNRVLANVIDPDNIKQAFHRSGLFPFLIDNFNGGQIQ